jgi:hypothetical protein
MSIYDRLCRPKWKILKNIQTHFLLLKVSLCFHDYVKSQAEYNKAVSKDGWCYTWECVKTSINQKFTT